MIFALFNVLFLQQVLSQVDGDHFVKKKLSKHLRAPDNKSTEFGFLGGGSQYNGELNLSSQFNPNFIKPSIGGVLRRNLNSRWAFRLNGMWGKLVGDDSQGQSILQNSRGFAFEGSFIELSGQYEFNFIPYCACDNRQYLTPFAFIGLGAGRYKTELSYVGGENGDIGGDANSGSAVAAVLPFGIGLKYKLSHRFLASAEWGIRKTYTDYIDQVSTIYATSGSQIGNSKNYDWYSILGLSLTIRLGPELTTCVFGQ